HLVLVHDAHAPIDRQRVKGVACVVVREVDFVARVQDLAAAAAPDHELFAGKRAYVRADLALLAHDVAAGGVAHDAVGVRYGEGGHRYFIAERERMRPMSSAGNVTLEPSSGRSNGT